MMHYFRPLFQPHFIACISFYLLIRLDRETQWISFPEFICYNVNDFLCLPIILTLTICTLRFFKQDYNIQLSGKLILGEAIFYSVLFEFLLPLYSTKYTADSIDVLMYILGAGFYWMMMRREPIINWLT